jgi:hypothetical protein
MTRTIDKDNPAELEDRHPAGSEQLAEGKKPYRKPELAKYEQVHGIALGLH